MRSTIRTCVYVVILLSSGLSHFAHSDASRAELSKVMQPEILEKSAKGEPQHIVIEIKPTRAFRVVAEEARAQFEARNLRFTEAAFYKTALYKEYAAECESIAEKIFSRTPVGKSRLNSIYFKDATLIAEVSEVSALRWIAFHKEVKGIYRPQTRFWTVDPSDMLFDRHPSCFSGFCLDTEK